MVTKKLINFDDEDIEIIKYYTNNLDFNSKSEFIRWLVRNFAKTKDPIEELKEIELKKNKVIKELKELEEREREIKSIEQFIAIEKESSELELKKALLMISEKIMAEKSEVEINDCARYWSKKINTPIDRLMILAKKEASSKL